MTNPASDLDIHDPHPTFRSGAATTTLIDTTPNPSSGIALTTVPIFSTMSEVRTASVSPVPWRKRDAFAAA